MKRIIGRLFRRFLESEIPLPIPYQPSRYDADRIKKMILDRAFTHNTGGEITSLEKECADYCRVSLALSTNSGTSALSLAVKSLGIGRGDEVIVPAYTFVASAQAVLFAGAKPIFADIDATGTINPKDIVKHISKRTKAVMPVHMFGNPADMDTIARIAERHHLAVIEDCAQAIGARFQDKPVGSLGDVGCFSFNEKKAVPSGQGGMLLTNNQSVYERAKATRNTGIVQTETGVDVVTEGGTFFLTEMQAYLARAALRNLEHLNRIRRNNYHQFLAIIEPVRDYLTPITILPNAQPSFSRLILLLHSNKLAISRDQLLALLKDKGLPVQTFYPTPLPDYTLFQSEKRSRHNAYPGARRICNSQIGMEWSPYWQPHHIARIAEILCQTVLRHKKKGHRYA